MAKNARSIALDSAIKAELEVMLELGVAKAPISAKTLLSRLKEKGIIKGRLSTLSKPDRREMIALYRAKQLENSGITEPADYTYGSVNYYKQMNQQLRDELNVKKEQLSKCTENIVTIINIVESQTVLKVEDLLDP